MTRSTRVVEALALLREKSASQVREGMLRFGIPNERAIGVPVGEMRVIAKDLGRDQELAESLWHEEFYEARMLATMVADPKLVTASLMDAWCSDFDSWALCDTACFSLFHRTTHAYAKIKAWRSRQGEFQKRAAFALMASVAQHDKNADDGPFIACLTWIEEAASDSRKYVRKGVSWALRGIGERSEVLFMTAMALAKQLAQSGDKSERWVGRDAVRQLGRPVVMVRIRRREQKAALAKEVSVGKLAASKSTAKK